jgi:hypothetical protein
MPAPHGPPCSKSRPLFDDPSNGRAPVRAAARTSFCPAQQLLAPTPRRPRPPSVLSHGSSLQPPAARRGWPPCQTPQSHATPRSEAGYRMEQLSTRRCGATFHGVGPRRRAARMCARARARDGHPAGPRPAPHPRRRGAGRPAGRSPAAAGAARGGRQPGPFPAFALKEPGPLTAAVRLMGGPLAAAVRLIAGPLTAAGSRGTRWWP